MENRTATSAIFDFFRTLEGAVTAGRKATLGWNSPEMIALQVFVLPFTEMSFFVLVSVYAGNTTSQTQYVMVGNAMQVMCFSTIFALSNVVSQDKSQGTLGSLIITPANRFAIFLGRSLFQIVIATAMAAMGFVYAVAIFGLPFGNVDYVALGLTLLVTSVTMIGFGLLISSVGLYFRTAAIVANVFLFVGLLVCGVNFPISDLPSWLRLLSYAIPLTYGVSAVRMAIDGATVAGISPLLVTESLVGAILISVGYAITRIFEYSTRLTGKFEEF